MCAVGAHEVVVESPDHDTSLSHLSDQDVAHVVRAYVSRITDLKKDCRFRYITVFRNQGTLAGQDLEHPHSQIAAIPFLPRRVANELRTYQNYFKLKERCILCDISAQEVAGQVRTIDWDDQFVAFCPFASREPYETWILPLSHRSSFEEDVVTWDRQLHLASFLKSILRRLEAVAPAYHLILHTTPNVNASFDRQGHWKTLADDSHWRFELLPVSQPKFGSYGVEEAYYNDLRPELAAEELRNAHFV
jgi:UDPglucose--hexose-1-phosphate uridylyltransferase